METLTEKELKNAPEHEETETLHLEIFYPDHETRTESSTFEETKRKGKAEGLVCCICGDPAPEFHHAFVEWAFSNAVDWSLLKQIALCQVTTFKGASIKKLLIFSICQFVASKGFDWTAFDPLKPEIFVDSLEQMLPLCALHHREKERGIHLTTFPFWVLQAFPKKAGEHEFSQKS